MHEARHRPSRRNPRKPAYCETGRPYLRRTSGLDRDAERGRNQQVVVYAAAFPQFHSVIHAYEDIAVLANQQHAWLWSVSQHLEHHEVGTRKDGAVGLR